MTRMAGEGVVIGLVEGEPITIGGLAAAHRKGDHVIYGGPEVGAVWASSVQAQPPSKTIEESIDAIWADQKPDPRDYKTEPGLWRSDLLPQGISIDQAIKDGVW
jgi:hypothetical protein